jgi:hypothetical protein
MAVALSTPTQSAEKLNAGHSRSCRHCIAMITQQLCQHRCEQSASELDVYAAKLTRINVQTAISYRSPW